MRKRKKETVEDSQVLHISRFKEALKHGKGRASASFDLSYTVNGESIKESFALTTTPCHFGGFRWWLVCPGCNRRVIAFYWPYYSKHFRCRHCHGLTYIQRQMHKHWLEFADRDIALNRRIIKILKGVGQKGFSKLEALQLERAERRGLSIAYSCHKQNEKLQKRYL